MILLAAAGAAAAAAAAADPVDTVVSLYVSSSLRVHTSTISCAGIGICAKYNKCIHITMTNTTGLTAAADKQVYAKCTGTESWYIVYMY